MSDHRMHDCVEERKRASQMYPARCAILALVVSPGFPFNHREIACLARAR